MSDNLKGITLMVLAMAGLAGTDTLIKLLATVMPAPQVIAILGAGTTVTFTLAAFLRREPVFSRAFFHPAVLARGLSEGIAGISITASLALLPISTVSALMQVNPLLVTLGAALFFGETVGWRRWMAVGLGLLGMLLIIRPGFDPDAAIQALTGPHPAPPVFPGGMAGFDPALLLAVLAALALSARDLTTRAAPRHLPSLTLSAWGFCFVPPAALILLAFWPGGPPQPVSLPTLGLAFIGMLFTVAGYWALTASVRVGELSTVAPFRYSRLLFAAIIGLTLFGERPDRWTVIGALLIITAGLYAFLRENQRQRRAT
ncbi:DMT family transporter [Vannielia sp.]|uniref:DMT family transporter n=1 Tax=Vannielia sp. TaxID=2813045 RepID=UPI0026199A01|nr:DMT family transporter [Vannielia sp.]MDF1872480.1 DMT family transporter [Vannielia sp.]